MEKGISADDFIKTLAAKHRVLLLGGMAVIAHGLSRPTKDSDIWLDPLDSPDEWAAELAAAISNFPDVYLWSLAERRKLESQELAGEIQDLGVVRIGGLSLPLDVFRKPNELELDEFDAVWSGASRELAGGVRLPHEMDLYRTKANTGRDHDWKDQLFLESLVKTRFRERLPVCDLAEAAGMLDRFLDPEVLQYAQANPHPEVRELCLKYLREFEAEGDPYSRDILAAWKEPQAPV